MEQLPVEHPDLYNENVPIRAEEIERFKTRINTLQLRYTNIRNTLQQRAQEFVETGTSWTQEDIDMIAAFRENMDSLEGEIFGFQDIPYQLARDFTQIQSQYFLYLEMVGGIFGRSPADFLERDQVPYQWGRRDEGQIKRNLIEARLSSMNFDILEQEVQAKYQDFRQRGDEIRTRLDEMIANSKYSFEALESDLRTLTTEILDFQGEIQSISRYLPRLERQDDRNIRDGYENPYEEGTTEFELYRKHEIIYSLSETQGMTLYHNIHDMAFEIGDLEKGQTFRENIEKLGAIDVSQDPLGFFDLYQELLKSQSSDMTMGNNRETQTAARNNVNNVQQIFHETLEGTHKHDIGSYISTILEERGYFFDPYYKEHFPVESQTQQRISDFPTLQAIYDGLLSEQNIGEDVLHYIISERSFEGTLGHITVINLDHEDYKQYRLGLRGVKIGGIDAIFTRDSDRVFEANEMAHIAFAEMIGNNELLFFLGGVEISLFEGIIPAKNINEVNEFLSDMSSLNSLEANDENHARLQEEILRIFTFSYISDDNGDIEDSNYDATAQFMREQIESILKRRGVTQEDIAELLQVDKNIRGLIENINLSSEEIILIQQAYISAGRESLNTTVELRDKVRKAEELMVQVNPERNTLSRDENRTIQDVLHILGYYNDKIDGVWGTNTENAYLDYRTDRFPE